MTRGWAITLAVSLLLALFALFGGCEAARQRYRATLVMEVDGKTVTASSVFEAFVPFNIGFPGGRHNFDAIGTVPIVDLGPHGSVFWTFARTGAAVPLTHAPPTLYRICEDRNPDYSRLSKPGEICLHNLSFPFLYWVRPGSPNRPFPIHTATELRSHFGASVSVVRACIQPTRERLVTRIPKPPDWVVSRRMRKAQDPMYGGTTDFERE